LVTALSLHETKAEFGMNLLKSVHLENIITEVLTLTTVTG